MAEERLHFRRGYLPFRDLLANNLVVVGVVGGNEVRMILRRECTFIDGFKLVHLTKIKMHEKSRRILVTVIFSYIV